MGEGAAVGAEVAADRPYGAVDVGHERALGGGERGVAAAAEVDGELVLVAVEDVDAGGGAGVDAPGVLGPAVGPAHLVRVGGDPRGLGVRARRPPVGRAVVAARELEVVVDVVAARRGIEPTVRAEQVDPARVVVAVGVVDPHLDAAAGDDARRLGALVGPGHPAGVGDHEHELVVGIEVGVGVGADERVRVRVLQGGGAARPAAVDRAGHAGSRVVGGLAAERDDLALVDLHGDLRPLGLTVDPGVAEGHDAGRCGADQRGQVGAGEDDRRRRALHGVDVVAGCQPQRRHGGDDGAGGASCHRIPLVRGTAEPHRRRT